MPECVKALPFVRYAVTCNGAAIYDRIERRNVSSLHIPPDTALAIVNTMDGVMAFGDGLNDLTMVRDAGVGVAMANAVPEVLAAAKIVTASNDEDGVGIAIERALAL